MITLHRLNGQEIIINAELIESVESVPDTKVVLISNNQYIVKEKPGEVAKKVVEYKAKISAPADILDGYVSRSSGAKPKEQ